MTAQKAKTCVVCKDLFIPKQLTTERVCSLPCALNYARHKQQTKFAKETRRKRREFQASDRSYQLKKAQEAFNAFIRARDKGKPCISCGQTGSKMTAGHYKSVGAYPELRFEEDNCHGQCWWNCNRNKSGNIIEYRKNLVDKIGIERVEWLEGPHEQKNLTLDEIKEIREKYKGKLKSL